MKEKLSEVQERLLAELSAEWLDIEDFAYKFHAVGNTLNALENRCLIETRVHPDCKFYLGYRFQEQVRLIAKKNINSAAAVGE